MARPKKTDTSNEGAAGDATAPAAGESQPVKGKRFPKNKTEAVKRALRRMGWDARPVDIASWVWEKYKIPMDKSHVSTVKSTLLKRMRQDKGMESAAPAHEPVLEVEETYTDEAASLSIAELRMVKEVLKRIGSDRFCALPELLGS
jgi:hypothetical protein